MEHYVTLFDSLFLPQGLALHGSLEKFAGDHTLWILCMDEPTFEVLVRLNLRNVRLLRLVALETPELLRLRRERTAVEYCWTVTPFALRFVFEADSGVERVTYLDADIWFRRNPAPIFQEFEASGKQVLITDHAYSPEYDQSATSGQYCVQFMTFTRHGGEAVRSWWEKCCIEWCHARFEDGQFGDQKYLDDWPERFADRVHVLQHQAWTLAPWNATRFPYGNAVIYHFQGLRLMDGGRVNLVGGAYALPPMLIRYVYEPYLDSLRQALAALRRIGFEPKAQQRRPGFIQTIKAILRGVYVQRWRFNCRHQKAL